MKVVKKIGLVVAGVFVLLFGVLGILVIGDDGGILDDFIYDVKRFFKKDKQTQED